MSLFVNLFRHEFNMSIRRRGLWTAYGLLLLFYTIVLFLPPTGGGLTEGETITMSNLWGSAGRFILLFNVFLPVVGGILAADRMQRDFRLGVRELQISTPLSRPAYILGKYLGVLASLLLPVFLWVMAVAFVLAAIGLAPWAIVYAMPVACLAMTAPAFAFVTPFSLACPLIMPLRVYQILFTGYWFWGNFINPEAFPTISDTLLSAGGKLAYDGFFGGNPLRLAEIPPEFTTREAALNLIVLGLCILAVLIVLDRYLRWQSQRA